MSNPTQKRQRLLLLGGGFEQVIAVKIAQELGAYVIVFDGNADAPCRDVADEYYQVNIKNRTELLAKANDAAIDAVFVHAAELAIEAAAIAEHFDLPGLSGHAAILGSDKTQRADCFQKAGIRVPKFAALQADSIEADWIAAGEGITYPLIAKPTRMAGARGVEYIKDNTELKAYFQNENRAKDQDFQLEEYVEGTQLSTETVVIDGKPQRSAIAYRHYETTANLWPHQIEDGHSMPWDRDAEYRDRIEQTISACCLALGMKNGVLKGDLIISASDEIVVLEMAVRTSGGRFCDTVVPLHSGVSILYPLIEMTLGRKPTKSFFEPKHFVGVSQRFVFIDAGTGLKQYKTIQHILLQQHVAGYWFRNDLNQLEKAPVVQSHGDRIGYVICTGATRDEADRNASRVVVQIRDALIEGGLK